MVRVKICGITNVEDALAAVKYGADALGFVFAPSPRRVKSATVRRITEQVPPFVGKVGVFVNSGLDKVRETMLSCNLDLAQLHGNEDAEFCSALFPKVIKVFTPANLPAEEDIKYFHAVAYMLDRNKGLQRGPLERIWELSARVRHCGPLILGGGLTPDNVSEAIRVARPYAVDVSSGIESRPGKKDHAKMRAFIMAAKRSLNGIEG